VAFAVTAVVVRRRLVLRRDAALAQVPVSIRALVKEYAGGYRAVDDVSFRVEPGQVVGLLGPNGAGKTTTLRVLVGLITPTSGAVHVFGEPVVPGAPVLARLGAFIEGPGFLPHLTGRENLRLYWAATGRPESEAEFETALQIAGLGLSIDRRVRAYSHGMRQRLGIAQAMLGLPEVLVLDEPTNGLDPPQIAEMREVLKDYARTGRTVVISSHLLAEVEQTCTHVVVMHKGRLVAAGPTAEIAGRGGLQLAVPDAAEAARVLAAAGIAADLVPARRALEDVFLDLIGDNP
jgi:ABC-2 type transport system ATP-binding protein